MFEALHAVPFRVARMMTTHPFLARMLGVADDVAQIPTHVPRDRVRNLDIFDLPGAAESIHGAWKRVQDKNPDVFYTPRHGGFWVFARAELIAQALSDPGLYSSANSISIPPMPKFTPPMLPIASDAPDHTAFRSPINMALSPKAVQGFAAEARELAIELIEGFKPRGGCEFTSEFAAHLPMTIFLRMVDLPMTDREYLVSLTEHMLHTEQPATRAGYALEVFEYLDRWVRARRKNPGNDLLSKIVQIRVGDRPITHHEALGEAAQALFGGLDTVASTMGFIAHHLATHPEHARALADDPSRIPQAIEELIRRHSLPVFARKLTRDIEVNGVRIKQGEQVMLPIFLHGLDERAWIDPMNVDLTRKTAEHVAFGKGAHKCPGANLARVEIKLFLEEWLKRIPKFGVKPGTQPVNIPGQVVGIKDLHLVWPTS